jgi:hypothetical protein
LQELKENIPTEIAAIPQEFRCISEIISAGARPA